jgi:hypothetical protein
MIHVTTDAGGPSGQGFRWIAIGEAPDALKKPKEVGGSGGGGGSVDLSDYARLDASNTFTAIQTILAGVPALRLIGSTPTSGNRSIFFRSATPAVTQASIEYDTLFGQLSFSVRQQDGGGSAEVYTLPSPAVPPSVTTLLKQGVADARYAQSDWRNQVQITQAAYDALSPPDPDTMYVIVG